MAETKDLEGGDTCTMEESKENADSAKPDEGDKDNKIIKSSALLKAHLH